MRCYLGKFAQIFLEEKSEHLKSLVQNSCFLLLTSVLDISFYHFKNQKTLKVHFCHVFRNKLYK